MKSSRRDRINKVVASVACIALVVGLMPLPAYADMEPQDTPGQPAPDTTPSAVEEDAAPEPSDGVEQPGEQPSEEAGKESTPDSTAVPESGDGADQPGEKAAEKPAAGPVDEPAAAPAAGSAAGGQVEEAPASKPSVNVDGVDSADNNSANPKDEATKATELLKGAQSGTLKSAEPLLAAQSEKDGQSAKASFDPDKVTITPDDGSGNIEVFLPFTVNDEGPERTYTITNNNAEGVTITNFQFTKLGRYFTFERISSSDTIPGNGGTAQYKVKLIPGCGGGVASCCYPAIEVSFKDAGGAEYQKSHTFSLAFVDLTGYSPDQMILNRTVLDIGDIVYGPTQVTFKRTISVTNADPGALGYFLERPVASDWVIDDFTYGGQSIKKGDRAAVAGNYPVTIVLHPKDRLTVGPHEEQLELRFYTLGQGGYYTFSKYVTLKYNVVVPEGTHKVSAFGSGRGKVVVEPSYAKKGGWVTLYAIPQEGFSVLGVEVEEGGVPIYPILTDKTAWGFNMGESDVRLYVRFSSLDVPTFYTITVQESEGGTATANTIATNTIGSEITLQATPDEYHVFDYWEVIEGDVTPANPYSETTTFTFKGKAVVVKPHFKEKDFSATAITVLQTEDGVGIATPTYTVKAGETITLEAKPNPGRYFDHWEVISGDVTLADPKSEATTFVSNGGPVVVKPHFYGLTVAFNLISVKESEGGTGKAEPDLLFTFSEADVTLTATPRTTYVFDHWEVIYGGVQLDDAYSATTKFRYQGNPVTVKPIFREGEGVVISPNLYTTIQLADGEEGGDAFAYPVGQVKGQPVCLTAIPHQGYRFKEWRVLSDGVNVGDLNLAETSFTMGSSDVVVQPVFEEDSNTMLMMEHDVFQTVYFEGDALDVSGLTIVVPQPDGDTETIAVTKDMVSGFDSSKTGKQTLTVTYGDFTATLDIEVKEKTNPVNPTNPEKSIPAFSVDGITYNGAAYLLRPTIMDGANTLSINEDYSVAYQKKSGAGWVNTSDVKDVGTYRVFVTGLGDYAGSTADAEFSIAPAILTVAAVAMSKTYGEVDPTPTYTADGFQGDDTEASVMSGNVSRSDKSEHVGFYEIGLGALSAGNNYTISYTPASLTIGQKEVGLVWSNTIFTYNGDDHVPTATATGLVGNDTCDVTVSGAVSGAGSHTATATGLSNGDYKLPAENTTKFKVFPKPIVVTTGSGTKEYDGTALTCADASITGLVGNETATATATGSQTEVGNSKNTYSIEWGTAKQGNYAINFNLGTLEVKENTSEVKLTAPSDSKIYDGDPLTCDGAGDKKVVASGLPEGFTIEATATGSQTDAGSSANVVDDGYVIWSPDDVDKTECFTNVAKVDGELVVKPKAVTITAKSEEFTYDGAAHSNGGYDVEGLVGEDALSAVVEGSIMFPGQSPVANKVASHEFVVGTPENYDVKYTDGELTMVNASVPLAIVTASGTWVYDGFPHSNAAVKIASGSLFEDDELVASAAGSVTNVSDTAKGNNIVAEGYKVMHGDVDVTASYVIAIEPGTLSIEPAKATITVTSASKVQGEADPAFTGTVEGLVAEGDLSSVAYKRAIADEAPGAYKGALTASYTENANYDVTVKNGDFTIKVKESGSGSIAPTPNDNSGSSAQGTSNGDGNASQSAQGSDDGALQDAPIADDATPLATQPEQTTQVAQVVGRTAAKADESIANNETPQAGMAAGSETAGSAAESTADDDANPAGMLVPIAAIVVAGGLCAACANIAIRRRRG